MQHVCVSKQTMNVYRCMVSSNWRNLFQKLDVLNGGIQIIVNDKRKFF